MELSEIQEWIDMQYKRLHEQFDGDNLSPDTLILGKAVKLTEEVGELCSEVLGSLSFQRKEKLTEHSNEKLGLEVADVLITTLLLAKSLDVDVVAALKSKIETINSRY